MVKTVILVGIISGFLLDATVRYYLYSSKIFFYDYSHVGFDFSGDVLS